MAVALEKTSNIGTHECKNFRRKVFNSHKLIALPLATNYQQIAKSLGYVEANRNLYHLNDRMVINDFSVSFSQDELATFAQKKAEACSLYRDELSSDDETLIKHYVCMALGYGIQQVRK